MPWINLLMVFVPVGFAVRYAELSAKMIFAVNFLAMLPIANVLAFGIDQATMYIGIQFGDLLSMSFRYVCHRLSDQCSCFTL